MKRIALCLLLVAMGAARVAFGEAQPPLPQAGPVLAFPAAETKAVVIQGSTVFEYAPHAAARPLASAPFEVVSAVLLGTTRIVAFARPSQYALYSIPDNRWETLPSPPGEPFEFMLALDDQRALAGTSLFRNLPPRVELRHAYILDIRTRQWRRTADSNRGWYETWGPPGARLTDGRILMAGHYAVETFDPVSETWTLHGRINTGPVRVVALPDGKALLLGASTSALFDGSRNALIEFPGLRVTRRDYSATLLPNGQVLVAGGWVSRGGFIPEEDRAPPMETILIDPATGSFRSGTPLAQPRATLGSALLGNGQLLFLGGISASYARSDNIGGPAAYAEYTRSVESHAWEPGFSGRLRAGSYTATVTQPAFADGGFWGIEAQSSGALDGGVNFGGMLEAGGAEPGFGAFFLPSAQTATVRVDLQYPQPAGGDRRPSALLKILDSSGATVAGPHVVDASGVYSAPLQAGFHVVELRTAPEHASMSYQASVTATQLTSGASAGGLIRRGFGVTGFVNFYLSSEQDVRLRLMNRNTYGSERGAGEAILTLRDASGNIVYRGGPGAE